MCLLPQAVRCDEGCQTVHDRNHRCYSSAHSGGWCVWRANVGSYRLLHYLYTPRSSAHQRRSKNVSRKNLSMREVSELLSSSGTYIHALTCSLDIYNSLCMLYVRIREQPWNVLGYLSTYTTTWSRQSKHFAVQAPPPFIVQGIQNMQRFKLPAGSQAHATVSLYRTPVFLMGSEEPTMLGLNSHAHRIVCMQRAFYILKKLRRT